MEIVILICAEALPIAFSAVTVCSVVGCRAVGVPDMAQLILSSDKPAGSAGEMLQFVTGDFAMMAGVWVEMGKLTNTESAAVG